MRPRIMNRALALVFVCTFGTAASFYLLLSVVPLYATSVGAGGIGAGGATGALMLATVAAELATPRLLARFGYRLVLALVLTSSATVVVVGMVVFGAGFGVTQNASLLLMFERVSSSGYGTVSALWNLAYDAGLGVGAAGFGVLAAQTGYAAAFGLTAAVMLAALAPAWRDRTARRATL